MSRSIKRTITVDNIEYGWVLDGNTVNGFRDTHIRVHRIGVNSGILYIDPYNWHFEIRPKFIAQAIVFALNSGWEPVTAKQKMYISYSNGNYMVLPDEIKFGYQLKDA